MSKAAGKVRSVMVPAMAWASFGFSVLGGALAPGMWLGDAFSSVIGVLGWLTPLAFIVLLAFAVRDFGMDGEPNKLAVYSAMLLPSLAAATPGAIGVWIAQRCQDLVGWASAPLTEALGSGSATVLTLSLLAVSVIFAQRAVKGGKGNKGAKVSATAVA